MYFKSKVLIFFSVLLFAFFCFAFSAQAATYYWVGGTTNANTSNAANWSTSAGACADNANVNVPGASDEVHFVSNCTNSATVNSALSVTNFYMDTGYSGTVTLGANLTASNLLSMAAGTLATADKAVSTSAFTITAGSITRTTGTFNSGIISADGTTLTFSKNGATPPVFAGAVNATYAVILMSGTTFNGAVNFNKTGGAAVASGGNTYNSTASFTNSGSNYWMIAKNAADTYNGDVTLASTGSNAIYASDVGTNTYAGNITVTSTGSSTGVFFGFNGAGVSNIAADKTISVGTFSVGTLSLEDIRYQNTADLSLTLTGSAILTLSSGNVFTGSVNFAAPGIILGASTFNGATAVLTKTGSGGSQGTGGATFSANTSATIADSGSGNFILGYNTGDTFNGNVTLNNSGAGGIYLAYGAFTSTFAGNVSASKTSGAISFGGNGGTMNFTKASGTQTLDCGGAAIPKLTHSGTGTLQLTGNNLTVSTTFTNSAGTFDLNGKNLTTTGATVSVSGTLQLIGDETFGSVAPTLNAGSTVIYTAISSSRDIKNWSYKNLTINGSGGTFTLPANTTVAGNLTITAGTLDAKSGSNYALNVSGNWSNSGTFTPRLGTVTLNGTTQVITGANAFYNLTISAPNTVTFPSGATQTISGTFTATGTGANGITLNSSTPGSAATLSSAGTVTCDYLTFRDLTATGGATWDPGVHSTSVSGNTGWVSNTDTSITSFNFSSPSVTGTVNNTNHTVTLTVPYGTNVTSLTPTIVLATGATISPTSGSAQNFTSPVTYTVTARDALTTQAFTVTVNSEAAPSSDAFITAFSFSSPAASGTINETNHTITFSVPYGTSVTSLSPTITLSGGATVSPTSDSAQNFTSPVTYTVTAQDAVTTRQYVVTVNVALNPAKAITAFNFNVLNPAVTGTITEGSHTISLDVPQGTSVTALVPTITITGSSVSPASGVARDFTNPVTYTVTAADSTTQAYTVTVNSVIVPVLHVKANDSGTSIVLNSGNGPNGTFYSSGVATNVTSVAGKIGNALGFDNSSVVQKVDFPLTGTTLQITGSITVSAWILTSGNSTIMGDASSFSSGYWLGTGTTRIFFYLNGVSNAFTDVSSMAGVWTHIAATYDGSRIKIYKNGLLAGDSPATGAIANLPAKLSLGISSSYATTGSLDDIRIYNQALNYSEISEIYNGGSGTESEIKSVEMPSLPSNVSLNSPYGISASVGSNNLNTPNRCFLDYNHRARIRSSADIKGVQFYTGGNAEAFNSLKIQIWREVSNNSFDMVAESEDLASSVVKGSVQYFNFNTPLTGIAVGDYVAICASTADIATLYAPTFSTGTLYYAAKTNPPQTGYAWKSQSALSNYLIPIEIYSTPPKYALIGDSIIAGHYGNYSFLEDNTTTSISSDIGYNLSALDSNATYQNMGIGGQTTSQIYSRFNSDIVGIKPQVLVLEGGVNDLAQSVAKSTYISNLTNMLNAAQADSNIKTIMLVKILPWTSGSTAQMQARDDWNNSLVTLAASYSKAIVVDASSYVGQFRAGGDAGNLWDIQTAYNADGVHFTSAGHQQIAQAIYDNLPSSTAQITGFSFASPSASGTINQTNHTIAVELPYGSTVTSLTPTITLSTGATVSPTSGSAQNFTNPITYTVTAQDSVTTQAYTVTVSVISDATAPTVSSVSSTPNSSGATITWTTNEASSSKVEYGLTTSYGSTTSESDTSTRVTSHSVSLTGLVSCVTYHYRVLSKDSANNEGVSSDGTFTTTGCTASSSVTNQSSSQITTASGGTLTLYDSNLNGLYLAVPASFSGSDANFQANQLDKTTTLNSISTPANYLSVGSYIYELKALTNATTSTSSFNNSITVSITYSASDVVGINPASLKIYRYDGSTWSQLSGCSVNTTNRTVSCTTTNFSVFGLFGTMASGGIGSTDVTYPNPTPPVGGFKLKIYSNSVPPSSAWTQTKTTFVYLLPIVSSDIVSVAFSNYPDFRDSYQQKYVTRFAWQLLPGNGEKTVYAKYFNKWGKSSEVVLGTTYLNGPSVIIDPGLKPTPGPITSLDTKLLSSPELSLSKEIKILYSKFKDIKTLQKFLNVNGFVIAKSGPGSLGKETTIFGPLTRKALLKFQAEWASQIYATGKPTGNLDKQTIKFINSIGK